MKLLDLTLDSPEENLALDDALLEEAEAGRQQADVLRLWEASRPAVIIGRSSRYEQEVDYDFCEQHSIPILRRCSGGASVVIGPGCLMYSVVLAYKQWPQLRMVDATHQFVLGKVATAVRQLVPNSRLQGTSDLTIDGRKFSGNSLRCKRDHLLYHGTLLCDFDLSLITAALRTPPRQPEYRDGRTHAAFLTNLKVQAPRLRAELQNVWRAKQQLDAWPQEAVRTLVAERYELESWNCQR
ncbi:MAG: lipoate-protein ligase A related protein [Planctomycetaceae bacterium]|nr:lipoate-protein ligase A related protein [Planctomycetaceae bacterium]